MKRELPLVVELAEPKLIAGEVDIQLSSQTFTNGRSKSLNVILGVLSDLVQDVTIDDVVA
jgi:hypothetical protein